MRLVVVALMIAGLLFERTESFAQAAARDAGGLKTRVLDRLLPLGGESRPRWFDRLTVRLSAPLGEYEGVSETDDQLILVTYSVDGAVPLSVER